MRGVLLGMLLEVFVVGSASAQSTIALEQTVILPPGRGWEDCVDVSDGRLSLVASSPPGRSGEEARIELFQDVNGYAMPLVRVVPTMDDLLVRSRIDAGTYCVRITVSNLLDHSRDDPNAGISKQVRFTLTHEPTP